ncbi:MAG: hypothetical protein OEW65_08090, partial [Thermoleophilia bacterium]|nr:hypothetical protein [Thermoleophilia bacterium]
MATTTVDTVAAKQAKQKKILIVLGVLLLAVAVLQGPKLWKQINGGSTAAAPTSAEQADAAAAAAAAAATGGVVPATAGTAGTAPATLTAVTVGSARVTPGPGQLRTFSLFTRKDPFVQALPSETSGVTSPTAEPTLSDTQPGAKAGAKAGAEAGAEAGSGSDAGAGTDSGSSSTSAPPEAAPTYATLGINGTPEQLTVKDTFPAQDKVFVLVSLKPKAAKIAVAGGAFTKGETVTLKMGKGLTLVNTATGARYALKLLYTGTAPEQVQGF